MILLKRKEKEALVIKLVKEGKTYRDITKNVHISPIEIKRIIDKATGDVGYQQPEKLEKEKLKKLSPYARAIQMFKEGYQLEDVVIEPDKDAWYHTTLLFRLFKAKKNGWRCGSIL